MDAHQHRTLRQPQLQDAVVQFKEGQTGLAAQTDRRGAHVQFRSRVFISPQIIARGQRTIGYSINPVALTAGLKRNRTLREVHAGNACRGIVFLVRAVILGPAAGR